MVIVTYNDGSGSGSAMKKPIRIHNTHKNRLVKKRTEMTIEKSVFKQQKAKKRRREITHLRPNLKTKKE